MRWERDVRLGDRVRWKIGGAAPRLGHAGSAAELAAALTGMEEASHFTLGRGANLLVADRGVDGAVFVLQGTLAGFREGDGWIEAGGGAGLPALVGRARRAAAAGWSFLEAVPGSVGGGLRMNAGSTDTGLWDRVDWVDALTPAGETVRLGAAEARPAYRRVGVPESWVFVGARFRVGRGDRAAVERDHRSRREAKIAAQVYELPSCGSVWRNPGPPHGAAWELVDRVGMRGARRGGACITDKHANFIANLGGATAADVLDLMRETRRRVREETGVELRPEIRFWGFTREELESVGAAE
ncbi:MAG: FAD-binding protein [Gemmatimonadota bacterium]|nr:FAD-binding protein [Gemmatimonadota bacterium]